MKKYDRFIGKKQLEASLTIEAALSLTIFIFTVIMLAMPMELLDIQRRIQMVLETTARELSQYAYIPYRFSEGEQIGNTAGTEDAADIGGLFAQGALRAALAVKLEKAAGKGRISGLDLSNTTISENGEEIHLQAEYRIMLPFAFFLPDSVPAVSRSFRRGWTGSTGGRNRKGDGEKGQSETMVYVGRTRTRYHISPSCHYISNDIQAVAWEDIREKLSSSGSHYKPCGVCGSGAGEPMTVYVMPNGRYYHSRQDCSSIAYYVQKVPLSEVEDLGACSYCGK